MKSVARFKTTAASTMTTPANQSERHHAPNFNFDALANCGPYPVCI